MMIAITDADPRDAVETIVGRQSRDDKPMDVIRGLMIGAALSTPIWATLGFLLLR
jgi:hypothetical protein